MNYEYQEDSNLPQGWELAVYDDGKVLVCSSGTCPEELGGYNSAQDYESAMSEVESLIEDLSYGGGY